MGSGRARLNPISPPVSSMVVEVFSQRAVRRDQGFKAGRQGTLEWKPGSCQSLSGKTLHRQVPSHMRARSFASLSLVVPTAGRLCKSCGCVEEPVSRNAVHTRRQCLPVLSLGSGASPWSEGCGNRKDNNRRIELIARQCRGEIKSEKKKRKKKKTESDEMNDTGSKIARSRRLGELVKAYLYATMQAPFTRLPVHRVPVHCSCGALGWRLSFRVMSCAAESR